MLSRYDRFGEHPWVVAEQLFLLPAFYCDSLHIFIISESLEQENSICHTSPMQTHGKGVLFDLDGTLVNTIRDIREAINTALIAEHLSPIDDAQTKMVVGQGLAKALRGALALSGRMVSESRLEELYRILIEYYEGHACVYSRPYPGVMDLLCLLSAKGISLGILSNKANELVDMIVSKLFPGVSFAFVQGMTEGVPHKPDPRAFDPFLTATGLGRDHILYVGDSEVDWRFANAAKCAVALVSWGFRGRGELEKLDRKVICDTIADVEGRIDGIQ